MSSLKEFKKKPLYYYHLNKSTGEVIKETLNYKVEEVILKDAIALRFRFTMGKNHMYMYEWTIGNVSDQGIYIVTFDDDLEAAADKFKKYWQKKLQGQQDKIEKEQLRYDEMKALYEKIC